MIISNKSTFELNDNAKLINDSFSSDYGYAPASLPASSITTFKAGNIAVIDSTVTAKGNNELSARSGNVIFQNSKLEVAENAVLTFSSAGGALLLDSGSKLDLAGKMKGNVFSDADATVAFQSSNARLNGTLSGSANAVFNADYALSNLNRSNNFEFSNITISAGKTLDIGTTALKASKKISGGTISAILTDAAKTTPIITADAAENVTIKLNMSAASSAQTTLYHITNETTGFKLGDYSTSRYAVSSKNFTSQILDLDDKSLDSLTEEQLDALDKIDDLLAKFARNPEKKYQILREVAPDLSKSVSMTDESTAKRIMHAVSSRFNTPVSRQISPYSRGGYYYRRMHGRSGGDFEAGQGAVWAQGLYNHAEQRGKEGFSSDSAGFAAGIEAYVSDDFKAGFGYSYAATSIDADRSDTDVYTHTGFAYAHYQPERFYTNFFAGVGHSSYEDTTKIAKLESDYQTNTISAQIAVGYAAPVLSPEAALRVINTHQKAYTDALGAELEAKSSVTATAVGGFRLSKRYRLRANTAASFVPELKAAVSYDFARSNQNRTAVLPNGASYVVETEKDKRFGVEAGAGFSFGFEKIGSLSLMYDGMFQGKLQSHSVLLNMKINL
ncbi:MAG: autotransporter outer membrane beta-barrel domain-containing protein [Acetobacter sp.]|nr:autotransporter outer membrane beta-barrel domain-containing protein [Acetobacter sp.]